jgi:hypothetical protein
MLPDILTGHRGARLTARASQTTVTGPQARAPNRGGASSMWRSRPPSARRALVAEGDAAMAAGQAPPALKHAPVVPGYGYRISGQRSKKVV